MIDNIIALAAPHLCSGCGIEGDALCPNCKYDIISEPFEHCAACGKGLPRSNGICSLCDMQYSRAWCVANRRDALRNLISDYKYRNVKAAHKHLADLLDEHLPELPENTVIVPIPTINSHIRRRGYDHMLLIARRLAKLRKMPLSTHLERANSYTQQSSGRAKRIEQAKNAFRCSYALDKNKIYLVVDDVVTTGSTVNYASKTLREAGASEVWVASISRQTLD